MLPEDLRYTSDHEWVRILDDGSAEFGITDFAQDALGDIVYVQLPDVGLEMTAGQSVAEVESVKSVSEIYAPLAGTVTAVNDGLADSPETINADAYGGGWLIRFAPAADGDGSGLLDAPGYAALTQKS